MSEIFTGDLPTPVKYFNDSIRNSYKILERNALDNALSKLPAELRGDYADILLFEELDEEAKVIVKAADKLSALIKCIEERKAGNTEFCEAEAATRKRILEANVPEAEVFLEEFIPAYELTLDRL
jgi:5'-deoxynucleotidase